MKPYDPNRTDPPSKFRSEPDRRGWSADLPPHLRESIPHAARDMDQYPAEYQEIIKEYLKGLQEDK